MKARKRFRAFIAVGVLIITPDTGKFFRIPR